MVDSAHINCGGGRGGLVDEGNVQAIVVAHPGGVEVADLCVSNFAPLSSAAPNTMVGQVSLLSSANMTFQERSRIWRKKPNCFKLLSELVQTQVDQLEKSYLSHGLQR